MCDNCIDVRDCRASIMCEALVAMQRGGVFTRDQISEAAQEIMNVLDESHCKHNIAFTNTTASVLDSEYPEFA